MQGIQAQSSFKKKHKVFIMLLSSLLFISLLGCEPKEIDVDKQWQEEILLENGKTIWVKRTVRYIGMPNKENNRFLIKDQTVDMSIEIPSTDIALMPPIWRFDAWPTLLDYDADKKTWFIVAHYLNCNAWRKAKMPASSRVQYIVENDKWVVVPLDEKLIGRKINLFEGITREEELRSNTVSVKDIEKSQRSRPSEYRVIRKSDPSCSRYLGSKIYR